MKTLLIVGPIALLSVVGFGWTSAAPSRSMEPASGLAEYVYLHVTRNEGTSPQDASRANSCRGTAGGTRS